MILMTTKLSRISDTIRHPDALIAAGAITAGFAIGSATVGLPIWLAASAGAVTWLLFAIELTNDKW